MTIDRLTEGLAALKRDFPGIWATVDRLREARGKDLADWPAWCFFPLAGGVAIASAGGPVTLEHSRLAAQITALASWRVTQGVYRFDEDLLAALWETPVKGELPVDLLHRLPEWCVFVETPRVEHVEGFLAHLEHDVNDGRQELRLLLITDTEPLAVALHLGGDLEASVAGFVAAATREAETMGVSVDFADVPAFVVELVEPMVSVLLYLCSEAAEIYHESGRRPLKPEPKKTKKGPRTFPADKIRAWDIGLRMGAALRRAASDASDDEGVEGESEHNRPRPHIRRAHWHTYWTGKKGAQVPVVKWLPPIPVNVEDLDELVPTVRPVGGDQP